MVIIMMMIMMIIIIIDRDVSTTIADFTLTHTNARDDIYVDI